MAKDYNTLMDALSQQEEALQNQLTSSPSAYSANVSPLSSDVQTQLELLKVKKQRDAARDKELKARWYTEPEQKAPVENKGLISRAFNLLGAPLYGIVGGVEALLGKGTRKGLANIVENVKERETFGDLMRKYGASNTTALPIGLTLDILFDPVNWLTMGTAVTIPRLAMGIKAAGLKGAVSAVKSSALSKASALSKLIPSSKKIIGASEDIGRFKSLLQRSSELKGALAKKAIASKEEYSGLRGMTLAEESLEEGFLEKGVVGLGALTRAGIERFPQSLKNFIQSVTPDPNWWANLMNKKYGKLPVSILDDIDNINIFEDAASLNKKNLNKIIDEGAETAIYPELTRAENVTQVAARMAAEKGVDDMAREGFRRAIDEGETGIKWFDKWTKKVADWKVRDVAVGKAIVGPFQWYIDLFRTGVIGGSLSAHLNAIVGNAFFTSMIGVNVASRKLLGSVRSAYRTLNGNYDKDFIDDILNDSGWRSLLDENPQIFQVVTGIDADMFKSLGPLGKNIAGQKLLAQSLKSTKEEIAKMATKKGNIYKPSFIGIERGEEMATGIAKEPFRAAAVEATDIPGRIVARAGERARTGRRLVDDIPTTGISQEVIREGTAPTNWRIATEAKIDEGTATRFERLLYWYMTAPLKQYEKYDMSYKFGLAKYLSINGVSSAEIKNIKKFVILTTDDIVGVPGQDLFRLSPMKSLEVALETYMNYANMPAAIKMLRSMPFFGATFGSFMYGMGIKTAKTMAYNPAFFNKVQFALNEISGGKSPLERVALDQPYGQFYKQEGMLRLPWTQDNPVYVNLANMLPFYTMNIFQEPKRGRSDYSKTLGDEVANIVDRLPIMKTPEGQIMFDYLILPYILRETNPKGAFDQQLFPKDPSLMERIGYTSRAIVEPLIPAVAGLVAGVPTGYATQNYPDLINAIPSFRWRQLAYATQGKKSVGDTGKEPAASRMGRTAASGIGLPHYYLNLQYANKNK